MTERAQRKNPFKLLKSIQKAPKHDLHNQDFLVELYDRVLARLGDKLKTQKISVDDYVCQSALFLVKWLNAASRSKEYNKSMTLATYSKVLRLFEFMTPRQLLNYFPPDKFYDKYEEVIDYKYTMKFISTFEQNDLMADCAHIILMEYGNSEIRRFLIDMMIRTNDATGGEIVEKAITDLGIEPIYISKNSSVVCKKKKRIPKYLRLVK